MLRAVIRTNSLILIILLYLSMQTLFAQKPVFTNERLKESIRYGVVCTYNYDFDKADEIYKILVRERPDHPATTIFYAMMIYWENFPLTGTSAKSIIFVDSLLKSISNCEIMMRRDQDNKEAIFFDLVARLMLMQYYADNDLSKKVIAIVSLAYKLIRKGFLLKDEIVDFYYSTGLYNYYREAYPEFYPKYRAFALFFPKGDKKLGLQQLDYAGENSVFLSAEATSFLYYIYMNFESNYVIAMNYVNILNNHYPNNPLYLAARLQLMLLLKDYDDVQPYFNRLAGFSEKNRYFLMLNMIYKGIFEEKKNKNYEISKKFYFDAINISKDYSKVANDQLSLAYFGLSRIYNLEGNAKKSKEYRKTAISLSTFPEVNFDY